MRRALICIFFVLVVTSTGAQTPPRIGWEESFDDITKWKTALLNPHGTPMVSVTAEDGCIKFVTPVGALNPKMKRADWPEWPKNPASSFTNWPVNYDDVVDFDVYRYIVIRIREKATFFSMSITGKGLKIPYTTGIHAQDLKSLGLTGRQRVRFYCQTLNTHGHVKIDYIRLVSRLTPEEKKGFISDGVTIREEKRTAHPYHRLEALNARAGRPARKPGEGSEWVVYRDVGTGTEIWKMTDLATNEHQVSFNSDGSAFTVHGRPGEGFHIFDWTDRKFKLIKGGLRDARPRFSTTEPDAMIIAENTWLPRTGTSRPRRITIWRQDFRTGEKTRIASFEPKTWRVQEFASSPDSSKMTFGLRESPVVFLIDPEIKDISKRVREIKLSTRLKGVRLANNDTEIHWNNCYTYQGLMMDLKTGRVSQANRCTAGGHSAGGPHWTIGPYGQLMKLLVRNGLHPQTEATADDTKIFANYKEPVVTDYGHVSSNGRWMVTNGARGDVAGQHLLISTKDPATVLRTCFYNTSRNDWATNTYSRTSPDTTKLAWVSDQFGNGDVYIAITGRPAPPMELKATRAGGTVKLSWKAPKDTREVAGYRIYRSQTSGRGFVALNRTPVIETSYDDRRVGPGYYLVAAAEPSGIEGSFSNEAEGTPGIRMTRPPVTRTFHVEAEDCEWSPPLRMVLHGSASGSRYLRVHRASPKERASGFFKCSPRLAGGAYTVWMRCRAEAGPGSWTVGQFTYESMPISKTVEIAASPGDFAWVRGNRPLVRNTGYIAIGIRASADGLAADKLILSTDPKFDPNKSDAITVRPKPASGLAVAEKTPQSITLKWQPSPTLNIARYDVHVGGDPQKLGNETIIGSTTETQFKDWGLRPGTAYTYHVVAVDSRGNRSKIARIATQTKPQMIQTISLAVTPDEKALPKITFPIDVQADAPFMVWVKYQPAYVTSKLLRVGVEIDGKKVGTWRLRAPYRPMGWTLARKGDRTPRVFTDKVIADGKDVFDLTRGLHMVTFILDAELGADQHKFLKLTASNDHSYRPPGYDPRADFKKRRR